MTGAVVGLGTTIAWLGSDKELLCYKKITDFHFHQEMNSGALAESPLDDPPLRWKVTLEMVFALCNWCGEAFAVQNCYRRFTL